MNLLQEIIPRYTVEMVRVNGREMEWHPGLEFQEIYSFLGYTIHSPLVIVRVNGKLVKKTDREGFEIPDNGAVSVLNILRGG